MNLTINILELLIIVCLWMVTVSIALFLVSREKWDLLKDKRFLSVITTVLCAVTTVVNIVLIVSSLIVKIKY